MLNEILYWLLIIVGGFISVVILGTIVTIVVGMGGLIAQAGFLILWERDWFKAATVVTAFLLIVLLGAATG